MESSYRSENNGELLAMAMNGVGGEDEIELELGLSLGGNYNTRLQKLVPVHNGAHAPKSGPGSTDLGFGVQGCARSGGSWGFAGPDSEQEMDPRTKREIRALRRQEAKKKRGEKQLKRAISKGKLPIAARCSYPANVIYLNGGGARHDPEEPQCKKSKPGISRSDRADSMSVSEAANFSVDPAPVPTSSTSPALQRIPTAPLHFGVPALEFGQTGTGVMPCGFVGGGVEGNVIRPVATHGFGAPFQVCVEHGRSTGNRHDPEQNDGEGGSNGSAISTSSVGSDYRSSSREGPGGSSDTRSHSMQSILEQPQLNGGSSCIKSQSEQTAMSDLVESASGVLNCLEAIKMSSNDAQSNPHKRKEESKSDGMNTSSIENPERESNQQVDCKPPMSLNQCENNAPAALPYMRCVSTTGDGPNGKTVHGFLYRYTKVEVSIICVCHGSSFSPMEFVQHAGGRDVSHPLKHITVVPSAI